MGLWYCVTFDRAVSWDPILAIEYAKRECSYSVENNFRVLILNFLCVNSGGWIQLVVYSDLLPTKSLLLGFASSLGWF